MRGEDKDLSPSEADDYLAFARLEYKIDRFRRLRWMSSLVFGLLFSVLIMVLTDNAGARLLMGLAALGCVFGLASGAQSWARDKQTLREKEQGICERTEGDEDV